MTYYLYLLRCSDHSLYCGQTKDLKRRIKEHNEGKVKSAKYTRGRRPVKLVYWESHKTIGSVLKREAQIKRLTKKKKEDIVSDYKIGI